MSGTDAIEQVIALYAASIDGADRALAERIWSDASEVTFIHPRGEECGREQIIAAFYEGLMGGIFSERKLTPKNISAHIYGDTAWAEFGWDFEAKIKQDGSLFQSQGKETQIYRHEKGQWRIVHVHYSGTPVTGNLQGF